VGGQIGTELFAAWGIFCRLHFRAVWSHPSFQYPRGLLPRRDFTHMEGNMTTTLLSQTGKITRRELQAVPVPQATSTHQPLSHYQIVELLLETLGFRRIGCQVPDTGIQPQSRH
jgi:hypothetical protein